MGERYLLMVVVLLSLSSLALQMQPAEITVEGGAGTAFDQVFTVTNDEPRPQTVTFGLHRFSSYFSDSVSLSTERVVLMPQESANVQVRGTVPERLGPETHLLRITATGEDETVEAAVRIPIQGVPTLRPKVDVETRDVVDREAVTATATLYNFGNVIAYYDLTLEVRDGEEVVGTVTYPQKVQILPGAEEEIALLYTDVLAPGEYVLEVSGVVNDGAETVSQAAPLRVIIADDRRTIEVGQDLVLELERDGNIPEITYSIRRGSNELLRETAYVDADQLIIPTGTLEAGRYAVIVQTTHGRGTDTTEIVLEIKDRKVFSWQAALGVLMLSALGALFTPKGRLHLRIWRLERRISRREKELNRLIRKAHKLHDRR